MKQTSVSNLVPGWRVITWSIVVGLGMTVTVVDPPCAFAAASQVITIDENEHQTVELTWHEEREQQQDDVIAIDPNRATQLNVRQTLGDAVSISKNMQVIQLPRIPLVLGAEFELGSLLVVTREQRSTSSEPQRRMTARWLRPESSSYRMWYQQLGLDDEEPAATQLNRLNTARAPANAWVQSAESDERVAYSVFPSGQLLFPNSGATIRLQEEGNHFRFEHRSSGSGAQHTVVLRPQVIRRGTLTLRDSQLGIERVFIEKLDSLSSSMSFEDDSANRLLYQVELLQPLDMTNDATLTMDFWVGVECVPLPSMLKRHLHLEEALLVNSVAPNSPASRAGIESQDVLLEYASQPVAEVEQLVALIQANQDQPVSVTLLRHGEKLKQTIVAEPRIPTVEEERVYTLGAVVGREFDARTIQTAIDRWMVTAESGNEQQAAHPLAVSPRGRLRMVFVRPGVMLAADELEFGREIQLDDHRQLRIKAGAGDDLHLELKDRDHVIVFNEDELEKAPEGLRGVLQDVSRRFLWMGGPFEVGGEPLEFYPPGPLTLGWSPQVESTANWSATPLQIVVESDVEPLSSDMSTFQLRAINVVTRDRDVEQDVQVTVEVDPNLETRELKRRRKELQQTMQSLEQQILELEREIEALKNLESGGDRAPTRERRIRRRD